MARSLDYEPTIPNLVRRSADRFGEHDCIVTPDRRLSFTELESQSRGLATRLLHAGVGKGTRVGVLFPQGPDFLVATVAVTRIGAVAVLLSTFAREPELRRTVRFTDVDTLIAPRHLSGRDCEPSFESTWPTLRDASDRLLFLNDAPYLRRVMLIGETDRPWATGVPPLIELDGEHDAFDDELVRQVEAEVTPSDLMVMIHTSGATAEPKAVLHTHGAQVRHSWTLAQLYDFTPQVRTFTTMPFFWVGGLTVSLLTHLHVGAAVLTVERMDGPAMVELIRRERATRLVGWTVMERLAADPALAGQDLTWVSSLVANASADPQHRLDSLGMSETSGPHTGAPVTVDPVTVPEHLRGSFGPPLSGLQHKIVDLETRSIEVPDGTEGEILVRGASLMDGLYKRERAQTFDEDGWYHTGDKGFFRDAHLFFTGRLTEMIKTGGANVAPREVEIAIESLTGVRAAFVVGLPDARRGQVVAALVCPEPGASLDPDVVSAELRTLLSSYKVPRRIRILPYDEAPWLPSGKISKPGVAALLAAAEGTG